MNIFSPNFFKDDFIVNKNRFKELEEIESINSSQAKVPFKLEKIEKLKKKEKDTKNKLSFAKRSSNRITALTNYFAKFASDYFKEEVI